MSNALAEKSNSFSYAIGDFSSRCIAVECLGPEDQIVLLRNEPVIGAIVGLPDSLIIVGCHYASTSKVSNKNSVKNLGAIAEK